MDDFSPLGEPSALIHLGNSLANVHSCMMLPPAPVSTLYLRVTSWLGPISVGIWTVTKASVVESIQTSDISTVSGSALLLCPSVSHSVWGDVCRTTVTTLTSSQWGSSSVPTSLTFFCLPPLLWCLGALSLGPLCPLWDLGFQCPFFPHPWHMSSHAGHDDWPRGWDFMQCPHECTLSAGFLAGHDLFCFLMALTVFCSFNPMASRLSEMVICVQHTLSILGVVAFGLSVSSFLMSSLSLRALMSLHWMFHSFSSPDGKLHRSARAQRQSTSSSGDSPGWMWTSSSW